MINMKKQKFGVVALIRVLHKLGGENKAISVRQLSKETGLPQLNISVTLQRAKRQGLVSKFYWGYWILTEAGIALAKKTLNIQKKEDTEEITSRIK